MSVRTSWEEFFAVRKGHSDDLPVYSVQESRIGPGWRGGTPVYRALRAHQERWINWICNPWLSVEDETMISEARSGQLGIELDAFKPPDIRFCYANLLLIWSDTSRQLQVRCV
jgi:hypothetical protein